MVAQQAAAARGGFSPAQFRYLLASHIRLRLAAAALAAQAEPYQLSESTLPYLGPQ